MKRTLALLLIALLVLTLVGCGGSNISMKPSDTSTNAQQNEKETKENAPPATKKPDEPAKTEPAQTEPAPTEPQVVFEEFTAIDNDQCLVKITGIEENNIWGYTLKVYLENKTSDKTLMYSVTDGAVNGVSWDPFFATDVAAGKKKNDEINFSNDTLEKLLPEFTDIELALRVYDSNDWMADDIANEVIHIYPYGEDKATVYVREPQSTDTVIVDNDQISIIVTNYDSDSFWGYSANVYLVNKTDSNLTYSCDDVSVNGFMCDPFWATSVAPGKVKFTSIDWSQSSFEENGITTVEEIEMSLRVYDSDNWSAKDIFKETITLNP